MKRKLISAMLIAALTITAVGCGSNGNNGNDETQTSAPTETNNTQDISSEDYGVIPEVSLAFATEPYPDHTVPYIGVEKDFFKDVGITLEKVDSIDASSVPAVLASGQYDFASGAPSLFIPSMNDADFTTFTFTNMFLGYCLMGPEDATSYEEFIAQGMDRQEAIDATMAQLNGQVFTYPSESAIQAFVQSIFSVSSTSIDDIDTEVIDDDNGVALMLSGEAQYKVGGVPATATLASKGFKSVISAKDLIADAEATDESEEIRSVFQNGWTTTKAFYDDNHETILRLASVAFRICQYVNDNPADAAAIHVNYCNELAGTNFTAEEIEGLYISEIPLYTFEMQKEWFDDKANPFYYSYTVDSTIHMYEDEGIFEEGQYTADDIISADDIYAELTQYKAQADENFAKLEGASGEAAELYEKAKAQYDIFDYYDAAIFSDQALTLME